MGEVIGQRELRNDNAAIMRRVEAGESFTITRNGRPIADLLPHQAVPLDTPKQTLGQLQEHFRELPPIDGDQWRAERAHDDEVFGPDDPFEDPWQPTR